MALARGLTMATCVLSHEAMSSDVATGKPARRNKLTMPCNRGVRPPLGSPKVGGWSNAGRMTYRIMMPSRSPATPGNPSMSRADPIARLQSSNPEAVLTRNQTGAASVALPRWPAGRYQPDSCGRSRERDRIDHAKICYRLRRCGKR